MVEHLTAQGPVAIAPFGHRRLYAGGSRLLALRRCHLDPPQSGYDLRSGIEAAARFAPDGYTLLNAPGSTIVLGPNLHKYGVDVARDLKPVAPTVRAALAALGNKAVTASPEAFSALMRRDRERFGAVLREANIRID